MTASRRRLAAVGAGVLVLVGSWLAFRTSRAAPEGPAAGAARPVPVVAEPAVKGDIGVYLDGLGTVTPLAVVTVRTRVDGELMSVAFAEGQTVHAGDALAEIDPRPFAVQLAQAEGQLARDQALLENAKVDLARFQRLGGVVSRQEVDTQAALVRQYAGAIKVDEGQIANARLQLTYCHVTAPIGGRLGLRHVDPGNIVHASDPDGLVVITQLVPIGVVFTVPEDSLPAVVDGLRGEDALAVEAWDRQQTRRLATGRLLTVDNQIDPSTGTVRLKAEFPNDDAGLFPNQFVNARLLLHVRRDSTLVPLAAVQHGVQGTFVYVVKADHTVEVRPVQVGVSEGEQSAIDGGLEPGELVVVDGTDRLRSGSLVEVQRAPAGRTARGG